MYMAGLQQIESHRDSRSKQKVDAHNKTSYDKPFFEQKSKELSKGDDSIDIYPSSFSSNRIPLT